MMTTERAPIGRGFWLGWVFASTVGLVVGSAVLAVIVGSGLTVGPILPGAMLGASIGTAQWLVLLRRVSRASWWVLASSAGMALANGLLRAVGGAEVGELGGAIPAPIDGVIEGVIQGALIGMAQWLVLRTWVSRAGWWVLASAASLAASTAVLGVLFIVLGNLIGNIYAGLAVAVPGLGSVGIEIVLVALCCVSLAALVSYGAITGGVLVWLFKQPVTEEPSPSQSA